MTTGESDNIVLDAAEIWRAIGRLEGDTVALLEGQRELQVGLQDVRSEIREVRSEMRSDFGDVYRRIDRLFFAVLGIGGALVVAVVVNSFVTG